jgi:hypothetical protein
MPYWITDTLLVTPAFALVYFGIGVPWALALLPRTDWRKPALILASAFALAPAWLTAWMFVLGTLGAQTQTPLLRLELVAIGCVVIAAAGAFIAWRRYRVYRTEGKGLRTEFENSASHNDKPRTENRELRTQHTDLSPQSFHLTQSSVLQIDETILVALIAIALAVRWFVIAYWPHIAYDVLWVYGYQGRLYTLLGYIPNSIDYYPQFLSLQYTFGQLVYGAVNDHAARAVVPFLNVGSTLAVYALGARLFTRRVGIYAAAMWTLYHHVAEWSRMGDLEIALTSTFTLAAAHFLVAWRGVSGIGDQGLEERTEGKGLRTELVVVHHALLAGLMLGIALWTKPTAGAFVWGVGLVTAARIAFNVLGSQLIVHSSRFSLRNAKNTEQRTPNSEQKTQSSLFLRVALLTLLAAAPLGGVWYVRNLLLGHEAVRFPPAFWLTQAARSGAEFGWLLLALLLWTAYLLWRGWKYYPHPNPSPSEQGASRLLSLSHRWRMLLIVGVALVLAGTVPTIIMPARMGVVEWLLVISGGAFWAWGAVGSRFTVHSSQFTVLFTSLLLALPYFATWFFSYSYHYRLSFAIVPLLILPSAYLIAEVTGNRYQVSGIRTEGKKFRNEIFVHGERFTVHRSPFTVQEKNAPTELRTQNSEPRTRLVLLLGFVALSLPGIVLPLYDGATGWDGLWSGELADDTARQRSGNAALLNVVDGLQAYLDEHRDAPLRVIAPGIETLPFFFPLADIRIAPAPTRLDDLDGATYFINSHPQGTGVYERVPLLENQILGALGRQDIMRRAWGMDDGTFRFDVYELFTEQRFVPPLPSDIATTHIRFGEFARILGNDLGTFDFYTDRPVYLTLYWQALAPAPDDYSLYVHLRDADGNLIHNWDAPIALNTTLNPPRYYSTRMFQTGEYITDVRVLRLPEGKPLGQGLSLVVGFYDPLTNTRVPMTIDGAPSNDGYLVDDRMTIIEVPEG